MMTENFSCGYKATFYWWTGLLWKNFWCQQYIYNTCKWQLGYTQRQLKY